MSKYINPYTDFGFKKLFGEESSKDLLIDFLNAVLPKKHTIKSLSFRNSEHLGFVSANRRAIFDIFCEAENGEQFIVEMQKAEQLYFKDRALFYAAFPIREQGEKGKKWDFELKAVYLVGVLDFEYDEQEERRKFQRDVLLKDQDGDMFSDKLHFIFLQMPLFNKTESELETHYDKWIYFLKNLPSFEQIPQILREPIFERAFEKASIAKMDKEEFFRYEADLKIYRDNYAVLETAQIKGFRKGLEKGLEQGLAKGRTEGLTEGKAEGLVEGEAKGLRVGLLAVIAGRFGAVPPGLSKQLSAIQDTHTLQTLMTAAFSAASLADFEAEMPQE